tara:strand:+ start:2418 stop:2606 length:189 start_codon:yes stop_codon:yes gene_type:complete
MEKGLGFRKAERRYRLSETLRRISGRTIEFPKPLSKIGRHVLIIWAIKRQTDFEPAPSRAIQ